MSRLLRLYPRAWRERYGDEMVALLEERPITLSDRFDLIRGAVDARLHPQVRGAQAPEKELSVNHRLLGGLAAVGGLTWILGFAYLLLQPRDLEGQRDASIALIAVVFAGACIGIALGELGARPGNASSRRVGHVIVALNVGAVVMTLAGWPLLVVGLYAFPIIGMLAAARGVRNGVFPAWATPVFVGLGLATMAGYLGSIGQDIAIVMMSALGVAGLALGAQALGRGSAEVGPGSAA